MKAFNFFLLFLLCKTAFSGNPWDKITDKHHHFAFCCNLASAGGITGYKLTDRPVLSVVIATALTIGIGALKEGVYDGAMHKGVKDWKGDFAADVQGAVTGGFFAGMSIVLKKHREPVDLSAYKDINVPNAFIE